MKKANKELLNLQRFADGGEVGAEGSNAVSDNAQSDERAQADNTAEVQDAAEQVRDIPKEFEEKIRGEYKDAFNSKMHRIIDNRLKDVLPFKERSEKLEPVLRRLSVRYGIQSGDLDALIKAVETDAGLLENAAMDKGVPAEHLLHEAELQAELAKVRQAEEERKRAEEANRLYAQWAEQTEQARMYYPDLDFDSEMQGNERFKQLIGAGIDVKTAYEVAHKDEVLTRVAQSSARAAEKKVVDNIKAKGARPVENGVSASAGVSTGIDVNKLTDTDIEELIRRAKQGEVIDFKH